MRNTIKSVFYKNGYLLIVAVLLYLISFIFSNYWFYASSPVRVQKQLEVFLQKGEQKFEIFTADSAVLNQIIINNKEPQTALRYTGEGVGLFAYSSSNQGSLSLQFWNNNKVLPESRDLEKPDGNTIQHIQTANLNLLKRHSILKVNRLSPLLLFPFTGIISL